MRRIRELFFKKKNEYVGRRRSYSIQMTISASFTIISVCSVCFLSIMLYQQFVNKTKDITIERTEQVLNQAAINLEDYLRNMRRISDAMYYSVIKDKDLGYESMGVEMNLLYEANKDNLISIACYTNEGQLVAAAPVANEKENAQVAKREWFQDAVGQMEIFHFSTPHVQNLFDDPSYRYYWVISLSRAVELTNDGKSALGVLLVDMNYSSIEQLLSKANKDNTSEYLYLMDSSGEIIYHPKQKLIYADLYRENNLEAVCYDDGSQEEEFDGEKRLITVKTISYTGWKIVSVTPITSFQMGLKDMRFFMIMLVALSLLTLFVINQLVSGQIAKPLQKLNDSVKEWETGNLDSAIYVGGPIEVEHLGRALRAAVAQIRQMMQDILVEQEEKRKSELDALQSQMKKIGILSGNRERLSQKQRLNGFLEAMEGSGANIIWEIGNHEAMQTALTEEQLQNVEILVALENDETERAVDYLLEPETPSCPLYGVGCSEKNVYYLDKKLINVLIVPNEFHMGYESVAVMAAQLQEHITAQQNTMVNFLVVRPETMYEEDNQKLLFPLVQ